MELSKFAHIVEDVFDAIRSDQLAVSGDVVDILFQAIDVIKAMLEQRMNGSVYGEDTSKIEASLKALLPEGASSKKGAKAPAPAAKAAPAPAPAPAASASSGQLSESEIQELKEAVDGGLPIFRV
jgi:two-component system chemotaxis sensor kinase CheA